MPPKEGIFLKSLVVISLKNNKPSENPNFFIFYISVGYSPQNWYNQCKLVVPIMTDTIIHCANGVNECSDV